MTDLYLIKSASIQKQVKYLKEDNKRYKNMLVERDEEIKKIKEEYEKKIEKLKDELSFKDRMIKALKPKPKMRKVKNEN